VGREWSITKEGRGSRPFLYTAAQDLLQSLRLLDGLVILGLRDFSTVQELLHLLPRIAPELLPELLKLGDQIPDSARCRRLAL
jgi:hypothetical protein